MGVIHGAKRHAERLFPERLDDDMTAENPVRFIDAFVDHLALTTLGVQRATPAATGRPAYHPAALLQLSLYGSLDRLRSSRRWEQKPPRHVAVLGLLKPLRPAHKTIADCRQHTLQPLRQVCRACTVLCKPWDLFAGALVAIDGRKGKAVNAQARHVTPDKLPPLLQPIAQRIESDLQARDGQAPPEEAGPPGGAVADHGPAKSAALQPRKLRYTDLQAQ